MTATALASPIDWTTDTGFRSVVSEVLTALFTTLGLTQTADTGQINPATVTHPTVANTSQGYAIGRFNDTLQATSPIFFKLEFGSNTVAAQPQIWLTVGQGSNGSGTLTGTLTTRRASLWGGNQVSITTAYTTRYCYIPAQGYLGVHFKQGGVTVGGTDTFMGMLSIIRSTDATGAPTSNAVEVLTASSSAVGGGNNTNAGFAEFYSYSTATLYPAAGPTNGILSIPGGLLAAPLGLSTTLNGTTAYVAPTYTMDPAIRYSACLASALVADFPVGTQTAAPMALVGSAAMTFISLGKIVGCTTGQFNNTSAAFSMIAPWQ